MSYLMTLIVTKTVTLSIQDSATLEFVRTVDGEPISKMKVIPPDPDKEIPPLQFVVEPDGAGVARIMITPKDAASIQKSIYGSGEIVFPFEASIKSTLLDELKQFANLKALADYVVSNGRKIPE